MIRRVLLTCVMIIMAVAMQANDIGVITLRNNALKGLNVESGYEQEMAVWAYYCINGADGISIDYNEAVIILEKLVARDNDKVDSSKFSYVVEGYNMLGNCYENGYGVTKNIAIAKEYWQRAASYNHADAFEKLSKYKESKPLAKASTQKKENQTSIETFAQVDTKDSKSKENESVTNLKETSKKEESNKDVISKTSTTNNENTSVNKKTESNSFANEFGFTIKDTKKTSEFIIDLNGVSFKMIYVEGGVFQMGSNEEEADEEEKPIHNITLSDYYIGETEVTQELWNAVMGSNPSDFKGSRKPVENVSWDDCQEFVKKLNELTGENFRLPTEAEWEFAARGGKKSRRYKYSGSDEIKYVAWYEVNAYYVGAKSPSYGTNVVGKKNANELGIYDMTGNVLEWCADWSDKYKSSSQTNPTGPTTGSRRVCRGGCWNGSAQFSRVSCRNHVIPTYRYNYIGLRLVKPID